MRRALPNWLRYLNRCINELIMTKPFSLQTLMKLAQHQSDSATGRLGQLNRQQQGAQQSLDTLLEYRKDYQARLQEAARNGMSPADLRNFQQFINKLDEAISQQLKQVEQNKTSTQAGRNAFDAARRKLEDFVRRQRGDVKHHEECIDARDVIEGKEKADGRHDS